MSLGTLIKLGQTIIPSVPFIWYREDEMVCPIDYVGQLTISQTKTLYDCEIYTAPYYVVQRHVKDSANLYICLHSLMYYTLFPTQEKVLVIPNNFCRDVRFSVEIVPLGETVICELRGGLKVGESVSGSVFIHDAAFSPPGCLHFKVDNSREKSEFVCVLKCRDLDIHMACLFVLFNDLAGISIDRLVEESLEKIKKVV